jgi:Uncharacterised conserved protein
MEELWRYSDSNSSNNSSSSDNEGSVDLENEISSPATTSTTPTCMDKRPLPDKSSADPKKRRRWRTASSISTSSSLSSSLAVSQKTILATTSKVSSSATTATTTPGRWAVHCALVLPRRILALEVPPPALVTELARSTLQSQWKDASVVVVVATTTTANDSSVLSSESQLHVSLTRGGVAVQQANIEPFVTMLTRQVQAARVAPIVWPRCDEARCCCCNSCGGGGGDSGNNDSPWDLLPAEPCNAREPNVSTTKLYYYLVYKIVSPRRLVATLTRLVQCCNAALQAYHQVPYFDPPIFHVSVARLELLVLAPPPPPPAKDQDDDSKHPVRHGLSFETLAAWKRDFQQALRRQRFESMTTKVPSVNGDHSTTRKDSTVRNSKDLSLGAVVNLHAATNPDESGGSSDDDDDDTDEEKDFIVLSEIHCTFGTSKHYTIPFASS